MLDFVKRNLNPKGRKTGDCSTRALANILHISYEKALTLQYEEALKCCYDMTSKEVIDRIMTRYGWVKMRQPKKINHTYYRVKEMDEVADFYQMEEGVLVLVPRHWTVVRDDCIEDIWNCGNKRVSNYWVKES